MAFTQVIKTLGSVMASMKTAVDTWLSQNITNPSNPPLDRSLSLANACAPADLVGDIKNDFTFLSPAMTSVNLLDYNDCVSGNINAQGQESFSESSTAMITRTPVFINGDSIISPFACRRVYYDINGDFLERGASTGGSVQNPVGAVFVRFVVAKTVYNVHPDWMINAGEIQKEFMPFQLYRIIDQYSFNQAYNNTDLNFYSQVYKTFKRVGVIGDSLSVGYSQNPNNTDEKLTRNLDYCWAKCIGRDSNSYWLNFGTTGQNVLTWCSNATYGNVQMQATNNKCQLYIIGLGENDYMDVPLGSPSDIVDNPDTPASTYYGGYARIIQLIQRLNPSAKIICLTNPRESSARKPFNDAVRYIAGTKYTHADNVYLLDMVMYKSLFMDANKPLTIDKSNISHYSPLGYQIISKIMEYAISKLITDNYIDFMNIAFIPYDTGNPTANTMTE